MTNASETELNELYAECHPADCEEIIRVLGPRFAEADRYYAVLCSYVEALYAVRRLEEAAEAALALHEKALHDPETVERGLVPSEPMELYRKARSTQSRDFAFAGDMTAAAAVLEELVARGIASEIDRRTLERYRAGHRR